jgi:hypothetical protein
MVKVFDVIRVMNSDMAALRTFGSQHTEQIFCAPAQTTPLILVNQGEGLVAFGSNAVRLRLLRVTWRGHTHWHLPRQALCCTAT